MSAGQVLAHLSTSDQERNVALTRAELSSAEARVAQLEVSASNSERDALDSARNEVDRLRRRLETDNAALALATIHAPITGVVTTPNPQFLTGVWLNAGDKLLQIDDTDVVEAEIEIPQGDVALVKPGARVRLRPWSKRDQEIVGRVTSVFPNTGEESGAAATADQSTANGGSEPPADMPSRARVPILADDDNDIGRRDEPAPNVRMPRQRAIAARQPASAAANSDVSTVARVNASFPNAEMLLRPEMTGYAKISGPDMTLGQAYLRLCVRFFTVEIWSWVP